MSGTGGIDASIALQARPPAAPNPLQQIREYANASNSINQLKLFPGVQQLQQQAIQGGQLHLTQNINQAAAAALAHMMAKPIGSITHADATSGIAIGEAQHIPMGNAVGALAQFPQGDGPAFDANFRAWVLANSQPPASATGAVLPGQTTVDQGLGVQPVTVGARGLPGQGAMTPAGSALPVYPPASQQIGQVQWTDSGGTTHYGTAADYATQRGLGHLLGPMTPVTPGAGPFSGDLGASPAITPKDAASVRSLGPGGLASTSGPEPGVVRSKELQAEPAQVMADRVPRFQSDMFPLTQAQTALANAPTGKGSDALHTASSYINTFAPSMIQRGLAFISPVMSKDEVTAYDEAKKYLTQGQLGSPGATRSNEGLTTAGAASPSTSISKEAAQVVLKGMVALRRMEQDEGQSWIASGQPPSKLNQFRSDFQKQADPRVYTFDQMSPTDRQKTLASITDPKKRLSFMAGVERAERNGILTAPGTSQ